MVGYLKLVVKYSQSYLAQVFCRKDDTKDFEGYVPGLIFSTKNFGQKWLSMLRI